MVKILGGRLSNANIVRSSYICSICEKKGQHSEFYNKKELKEHKVQDHSYHTASAGYSL